MEAPSQDSIAMRPIPKNDQLEALEAIKRYKAQNPTKYEAKKAALFARYGLNIEEEVEATAPVLDANDVELEAVKAKVVKAKTKKDAK